MNELGAPLRIYLSDRWHLWLGLFSRGPLTGGRIHPRRQWGEEKSWALDGPERKALTRLVAWVTISVRGYLTESRVFRGSRAYLVIQTE